MPLKDSTIDKAVLAIAKLKGRDDWNRWSINLRFAMGHTWGYLDGSRIEPSDKTIPEHAEWVEGEINTRRRLWLSLSDSVQDNIFRHSESPAATLFRALKGAYQQTGASAEYYARTRYCEAKVSNYESISDFLSGLMNLAHEVNKQVPGDQGWIEDRMIAMQLIHTLPSCMSTLQTMLIQNAPAATNDMSWDLDKLRREVETEELRARANGENLGTKDELALMPKALAAESDKKGRKGDPPWLACKTCWDCGKTGHLRTKCTATEAEKEAYQKKKAAEKENANATEDSEERALCAEYVMNAALITDKGADGPKPWIVDSGCSNHFCPNKSDFVEYTPFDPPCQIALGNDSRVPSLGEGTILIACVAGGKRVVTGLLLDSRLRRWGGS
jgi:hypothetical protein